MREIKRTLAVVVVAVVVVVLLVVVAAVAVAYSAKRSELSVPPTTPTPSSA